MNTINIAFCIDKKYISQLCVSIKSIILSNANEFISFFIISDNLSEDDQQFIQKAVKEQNIKISFICINSNTFKDFPTLRHISIAMYFRLLLPLILPQDINKILYLDCDLICVDNLRKFYDSNISEYALSAIRDSSNDDIRIFNRLDYPVVNGYFNSGVLLLNLDYWRKHKITEKTISFIEENPKLCIFPDQDALNKILNGKIVWADFRYNCTIAFFYYVKHFSEAKISKTFFSSINEAVKNPCIIHFAGSPKPWNTDYKTYFKTLYAKIYFSTFSRNLKLKYSFCGLKILKWLLKQIFTTLHIKKFNDVIQEDSYSDFEQELIKKFE